MAEASAPPPVEGKPKKRGGCRRLLRGCLWFLFIIIVIGALFAMLFFHLPEKLGIGASSRAEKLLSDTPDRAASAAILEEAARTGLNTKGVHLYVLPMKSGDTSIAFAILNSMEGFAFPRGGEDPITQTLVAIGTAPTVRASGVEVVGFEFFDEDGRSYMTIAARTEDIEKVASGKMSTEEFTKASYGDIRFDEMFTAEMEQLQEFLSGSQ